MSYLYLIKSDVTWFNFNYTRTLTTALLLERERERVCVSVSVIHPRLSNRETCVRYSLRLMASVKFSSLLLIASCCVISSSLSNSLSSEGPELAVAKSLRLAPVVVYTQAVIHYLRRKWQLCAHRRAPIMQILFCSLQIARPGGRPVFRDHHALFILCVLHRGC